MPKLGNCCKFLQCLQIQREEAVTKVVISFYKNFQILFIFSTSIAFWALSNNFTDNFPQICVEHERTLEDICLNSTRLSSLPPELFYCQGLRVLSVSNNNLENIPNAIGSLRHLQNLNLSRNFISSVPENLKSCKNLTHLDLSCNSLQRLPDAITCLVGLQELFLNETYLEFLPANFGRLVNLRILELRHNSLLTLPKSMGRLTNLERIDIGGNEFKELPEVVGELSKLRELWIDFNQIRRVSPNIGKLHELQHFEANGNLLESLPEEMSSWHNVDVFSICTNNLKSLPNNFGMLRTLVTLKCEFCKLVELPDSISSLEQMEEIVVSHNQLIRLPTTIGMLRKLRFFFADDNNLQSLPDELCSCSALTVLSVSRNKLTDLPQNIGHLTKLKVLNLVGNYISSLPVSVLSMVNLSSLWLNENQTQPLIHLQYADVNSKTRLTCFMLPQSRGQVENGLKETKVTNIAAHTSPSRRICFANETQPSSKEVDCSEGNFQNVVLGEEQLEPRLMRSPTPYPKELRMMSKYMRSGQNLSQKSPQLSNVKEARIIANNYICNGLENASMIVDQHHYLNTADTENRYNDTYSIESLNIHPHIQTEVNNLNSQEEYFIHSHPTMQHYNVNNLAQIPNAEFLKQTLPNAYIYDNFYGTLSNPEEIPLSNDDQTVLRSYQPQQQFMTPPPYHIARNYTKKTLEDLSNYDSMRNQQYLLEKETSVDCLLPTFQESVSILEEKTNKFLNYDEQNNLLNGEEEVQNGVELTESASQTAKQLQQDDSIGKQVISNQLSATENYNPLETSLHKSESPLNYNTKKTTWLFGAHKNPTVKQITLKQETDFPAFHIGRISNEEGIYVLRIVQNSSASRLLSVNDKLLEINGHDFTDISLEEAKHILDNAGTPINIMLSRK